MPHLCSVQALIGLPKNVQSCVLSACGAPIALQLSLLVHEIHEVAIYTAFLNTLVESSIDLSRSKNVGGVSIKAL